MSLDDDMAEALKKREKQFAPIYLESGGHTATIVPGGTARLGPLTVAMGNDLKLTVTNGGPRDEVIRISSDPPPEARDVAPASMPRTPPC
jgi:hypothetical protein